MFLTSTVASDSKTGVINNDRYARAKATRNCPRLSSDGLQ